jgi:DNA polymerase III subunit delta
MFLFLYGEDTYRSRRKLKEIIEGYERSNKSSAGIVFWECSQDGAEKLQENFGTRTLFQEKRLYIIEHAFLLKDWNEEVFQNSEDFIVFFEERVPDKRTWLFKFLQKNATTQEFSLLEGLKLKNWIQQEFSIYHIKASSDVVEHLAFIVGSDLWQLSNEINKLVAFGKGMSVKKVDAELLVHSNISIDIFATIDAIAAKNKHKALDLISKHIEKNESPFYIFSMLAYQFRHLLVVNSTKNVQALKLHPFVLRKSMQAAQGFSQAELETIYKRLFTIDLKTKTGQINPEMALYLFAVTL